MYISCVPGVDGKNIRRALCSIRVHGDEDDRVTALLHEARGMDFPIHTKNT